MKPGLYPNLSYDEYDAIDAIRSTDLKVFQKSQLHARHARLHPKESKALDTGSALHALLLEPDVFEDWYVEAPTFGDQRKPANKAAKTAWLAENDGKVTLEPKQYAAVRGMADGVLQNPDAAELLKPGGQRETTVVWEREGRLCKARLDLFRSWRGVPTVVDLKSTSRGAKREDFARQAADFGYHISAAWYLEGLNALSPLSRQFVWLAVESSAPYVSCVHIVDLEWLIIGKKIMEECFRSLVEAETSGRWAGYRTDHIYPPAWLARQHEEILG